MRLHPLLASLTVIAGCLSPSAPTPPLLGSPPLYAAAPYQGAVAARAIRADVPDDFGGPDWLGQPLDANFQRLIGGTGSSLFPQAGQPAWRALNAFASERNIISTSEELNANARAWGLSGQLGYGQAQRYAYYRAVQITGVIQLNDATPMVQAPPQAVYYPSQIFYGHSYWVLVHGDSSTFDAGFGTVFPFFSGSVAVAQTQYHVQTSSGGRGLIPTTPSALFALPETVASAYNPAASPPVPVVVEYRQIPCSAVNNGRLCQPPRRFQVDFSNLQVGQTGSLFFGYSNWALQATCLVNGIPQGSRTLLAGQVRVGPNAIGPGLLVSASDNDTIECAVSGNYSRENHTGTLGQGTTTTLLAGTVNPVRSGVITGTREANTSYSLAWTMTRLP
jgi:hypothetical protein